MNIITL